MAEESEKIEVRRAEHGDAPALLGLIQALADYEKLPGPDPEACARLTRDAWPQNGEPPRFTAWLAELVVEENKGRQAVGYAITFETYSSFLALPTLYIEDIFVLPEFRRHAAGSALMERLIVEARARGCGRMDWVVLDWNTSAQQFYHRFGAVYMAEWQCYRLDMISPE